MSGRTGTQGELPAWQRSRLALLIAALGAPPMSPAERASLTWLASNELFTVENIAAVIRRSRGEES